MQLKLHYSEALVRRAVRAFWWRVVGWRFVIAMAALAVGLGVALWNGDRSWWVGAMGSLLAVGVAFVAAIYLVHMRASVGRFRRMQTPEGTMELGAERFRIRSDVGDAELAWRAVTEVWQFPEFWLVFLSRAEFFTLPTADLNAQAREFILTKTKR